MEVMTENDAPSFSIVDWVRVILVSVVALPILVAWFDWWTNLFS